MERKGFPLEKRLLFDLLLDTNWVRGRGTNLYDSATRIHCSQGAT